MSVDWFQANQAFQVLITALNDWEYDLSKTAFKPWDGNLYAASKQQQVIIGYLKWNVDRKDHADEFRQKLMMFSKEVHQFYADLEKGEINFDDAAEWAEATQILEGSQYQLIHYIVELWQFCESRKDTRVCDDKNATEVSDTVIEDHDGDARRALCPQPTPDILNTDEPIITSPVQSNAGVKSPVGRTLGQIAKTVQVGDATIRKAIDAAGIKRVGRSPREYDASEIHRIAKKRCEIINAKVRKRRDDAGEIQRWKDLLVEFGISIHDKIKATKR